LFLLILRFCRSFAKKSHRYHVVNTTQQSKRTMRKIVETIFSFLFQSEDDQELSIVSDYHNHYKRIDDFLQAMPEVLQLVHDDLKVLSQANEREREADFTTDNLLRVLIVKEIEGWNYRETTIRLNDSEFLQNFCRLFKKKTIDFTLLNNAYNAIQPETWQTVNRLFGIRMKHEGKIDIDHIRTEFLLILRFSRLFSQKIASLSCC
jgi:ferritin